MIAELLLQILTAHVAILGNSMGALDESELRSVFSLLGGDLEILESEDPEEGV